MRQYVVDAFTDSVFHGNQAALCFRFDEVLYGQIHNIKGVSVMLEYCSGKTTPVMLQYVI